MPNYQLPMGIFDPNSAYAQQMAADEAERQRAAQQIVQQMNQPQETPQAPVTVQQPAMQSAPMPNNNGLAAKAASVLTPLDDAGRILASQIAKFKMDYDAAEKAGDTEAMNRAHAGAQAIRDAAGQYGVDVSRLGANANTQAMQAMLQADYAKGVADMANMLSPQEHYAKKFNEYKAQGVSNGQAREMALNDTEAYEGQRMRMLGNAFARYGVNDQGEMNRFGAQIANLMYGQNPQSVALYDQYYANPMQQWKFDKNMEVQDKLYGQKLDFGQHQFDWTRQLNNDKFDFQLQLQKNQGDLQKTMLEMQMYYHGLEADKQRQFLIDNPALAPFVGGGKSKSANTKEPSEKQITTMQNARDIFDAAFNGNLYGDNIASAINELDKAKQSTSDEDARNTLEAMKYALNAKREGVALNDHGYIGAPDNFIDYYEAVANSGHPELVASLKWIYEAAKAKKANPDKQIPYDPSYYTGMRG